VTKPSLGLQDEMLITFLFLRTCEVQKVKVKSKVKVKARRMKYCG